MIGRAGVFPLYSKTQFEALAAETPPGATRANLEQFYLRAKAVGIDNVEEFSFPANFTDGVDLDAAATQASSVFVRELRRSGKSLAIMGATDLAGDLTDLGHELEVFTGSSAQAACYALADRLACLPEVAVALALLEDTALVGRSAVLRNDTKWPGVWSVVAADRHRALASGCRDDLDLVLRIFAAWEQAESPTGFANRWWLNEHALLQARAQQRDAIGALSQIMRHESSRPLDLAAGWTSRGWS